MTTDGIPAHKRLELYLAGIRTFVALMVFALNLYIAYRVSR